MEGRKWAVRWLMEERSQSESAKPTLFSGCQRHGSLQNRSSHLDARDARLQESG